MNAEQWRKFDQTDEWKAVKSAIFEKLAEARTLYVAADNFEEVCRIQGTEKILWFLSELPSHEIEQIKAKQNVPDGDGGTEEI